MAARNVYTNLAKGRATVRNRAMRRARSLKRCLVTGFDPRNRWVMTDTELRVVAQDIALAVDRARHAHKAWRRYRALSADWKQTFGEA